MKQEHHYSNFLTAPDSNGALSPSQVHPSAISALNDEPLRILIAPSGFKESLGPEEVAECVEEGLRKVVDGSVVEIRKTPLHDGGEGFCKALVSAHGGQIVEQTVTGPVKQPVGSHFGMIKKAGATTAVMDMAAAAGLRLVPTDCRDPTKTTSFGVGELIKSALDQGCTKIVIGCGDSGTSDGGAGMLQALGAKFLDTNGNELPNAAGGQSLEQLKSISLENLHPRLRNPQDKVQIEAVCNIKNILCGERGVARVYGPQKGATPEQVESLSKGLENYGKAVNQILGRDISTEPGSGASGGLGAGLMVINGKLRPRAEAINDYFEWDDIFQSPWDFVITAEGSIDSQSTQGKMTTEIARRAKEDGAQVVALAGTIGSGADSCLESGIEAFTSILQQPMSLGDAMRDTPKLLREGAERVMRMIMVGFNARTPSPGKTPSPNSRSRSRQPSGGGENGFGLELHHKLENLPSSDSNEMRRPSPLPRVHTC